MLDCLCGESRALSPAEVDLICWNWNINAVINIYKKYPHLRLATLLYIIFSKIWHYNMKSFIIYECVLIIFYEQQQLV